TVPASLSITSSFLGTTITANGTQPRWDIQLNVLAAVLREGVVGLVGPAGAGAVRVLGMQPQAAEDLVDHAPLVVQGQPDQPQRIGGDRRDRGAVVGLGVGAEQLLGEDAQAHLVGDRTGVRGCELLG